MTDAEIESDLAICKAATEGPWGLRPYGSRLLLSCGTGEDEVTFFTDEQQPAANAAFVARARQAWPLYIADVQRLRALVEAAHQEGFREGCKSVHKSPEAARLSWSFSDSRKALNPSEAPPC